MDEIKMEVCVDSIQSALNASAGGANRIELCSALSEGGLTPSIGLYRIVKNKIKIPVHVMIRPSGDDRFIYSDDEIEAMKTDIIIFKENYVDGFVFGILTPQKTINVSACKILLDAAAPIPVTFHRAFDFVAEPFEALEVIIKLGFKRLLTSGQADTAENGCCLIKKLMINFKNQITIMPGGGISEHNLQKILAETNAVEFHGTAKKIPGSRYSQRSTDNSTRIKLIPAKTCISSASGPKINLDGPKLSSSGPILNINSSGKMYSPTTTDTDTVKQMMRIAADVLQQRFL
ncbi:copper homeostasis protein cutC homolog isoform X2 [Lycorma delicatula]|uniref:copper homeostasis protein cutC homolog isoform X2 n=1 Tax=Lycorma delicatula TaxID=130591 RepID=UPI003F517C38